MIRVAELAMFAAPLLAFLLWRLAIARGLPAPPPRQLLLILGGLVLLEAVLVSVAVADRMPPGRYVPPALQDGQIVPGHMERAQ